MMPLYTEGDRVIAKNSHPDCGYIKGDTIEVISESLFAGDYVGKNLTRPNLNGGRAYMGDWFKGKLIKEKGKSPKDEYKIYIIGIPVATIRKTSKYGE